MLFQTLNKHGHLKNMSGRQIHISYNPHNLWFLAWKQFANLASPVMNKLREYDISFASQYLISIITMMKVNEIGVILCERYLLRLFCSLVHYFKFVNFVVGC